MGNKQHKQKKNVNPPTLLTLFGLTLVIIGAVINPIYFFGGIISLYCADNCYKRSKRGGGSGIGAYFFGLFFGLIGLLIHILVSNWRSKS